MDPYKFHDAGLQVDMLGQPLYVGDLILCKGYCSSDKNTFATITKVNRKSVAFNVEEHHHVYGPYKPRPDVHTGHWNSYPYSRIEIISTKRLRPGVEVLKLPPDFKQNADQSIQTFAKQHPEVLI